MAHGLSVNYKPYSTPLLENTWTSFHSILSFVLCWLFSLSLSSSVFFQVPIRRRRCQKQRVSGSLHRSALHFQPILDWRQEVRLARLRARDVILAAHRVVSPQWLFSVQPHPLQRRPGGHRQHLRAPHQCGHSKDGGKLRRAVGWENGLAALEAVLDRAIRPGNGGRAVLAHSNAGAPELVRRAASDDQRPALF